MTPDISDPFFFNLAEMCLVMYSVYSQDKNNISVQYIKNVIPDKILRILIQFQYLF